MILFQKRLMNLFFMVFGTVVLQAQEPGLRDDHGRTELMNYVIWQEVDIASIKGDIQQLWDVCYEYVQVWTGQVTDGKRQYEKVVMRRASCMDADILALQNREQDLAQCIEKTVVGICDLVSAGAELNAYDNDGKTVLNYCQTYQIYEVLMKHGVPFQYSVWVYFNPITTTIGLCGIAALTMYVYYLYQQGYLSYDTCMQVNQDFQLVGNQDLVNSVGDAVAVPFIEDITQDTFDIIESMGLSC